jgi:hypothetical protein
VIFELTLKKREKHESSFVTSNRQGGKYEKNQKYDEEQKRHHLPKVDVAWVMGKSFEFS